MRRFVFCTIALMIGGCSLFVDLDGLSGAAGNDGDAFVPGDARADAAADAPALQDAGPDPYRLTCPDAAIICDDFENEALGMRWSGVEINENGTAVIDDGGAVSPSDSLHIILPDNPDQVQRVERLYEDFGSLSALDCQFQIRLGSTNDDEDDDVEVFSLVLSAPGFDDYELDLNMRRGDFDLEQDTDTGEDGGALSRVEMFGTVGPGTWQAVRLATDLERVQVYIDSVLIYDKPLMTPFPGASADGTFSVGQINDGEPAAWDFRIDDVVCTGQPN